MNTDGNIPFPYNIFETLSLNSVIVCCEGETDCVSAHHFEQNTIGFPSATVFKEEWAEYFVNRDVVICFDQGKAGQDGCGELMRKLDSVASSIEIFTLPEEVDDVNDLLRLRNSQVKALHKKIRRIIANNKSLESIEEDLHERAAIMLTETINTNEISEYLANRFDQSNYTLGFN